MPGNVMHGRYALVGDGLLGVLGTVAKKALKFVPGLGTAILAGETIAEILPKARKALPAATGIIQAAPPVLTRINIPQAAAGAVGKITRLGGAGAVIAGGAVAGTAVARKVSQMLPGTQRRRIRRMNPLNPKALRRATRRLAGFNAFAVSTQQELARLCGPRRASAARRKRKCR